MDNKKYFLASAAITVASAALIIGATAKKPKKKSVYTGMILAGVAGFLGAAALAYQPTRQAKKRLRVEDMIDEMDAVQLESNISEVLADEDD